MRLDCGICIVRAWRAGDEASLARHADDVRVWRNLRDSFPHPYTLAHAHEWVRFAAAQRPVTHFAVEVAGEAVGGIGFVVQDDIERCSAEIGYWLGAEAWGRGIASAALRAVTRHAFHAFPLSRVYAVPFTANRASIRVLEKAGYSLEGIMRRSALKEGVVRDQALYAVTDDDPLP